MATDQEKAQALLAAAETATGAQRESLIQRAQALQSSSSTVASSTAIQELADLQFLAQNTGVSTAALNAATEKVGLNPGDYQGVADLLIRNGYTPGSNENFYGNNVALDIGAAILAERWKIGRAHV